jgi:hypothetical protein
VHVAGLVRQDRFPRNYSLVSLRDHFTKLNKVSTMADLGKGKEKEVVGDSVETSRTVAPTLPPTDPTASSSAAEDAVASTDPAQALAAPTGLPSETVEGPAPTAQLVNPFVLVVSVSRLFLTTRLITRKPCATEYPLPFNITSRIF